MQVRALPAIRLWQAVAVVAVVMLAVTVVDTPPPRPSATDRAIERVRQAVAYIGEYDPDLPREYVVALAVNNYVAGHLSGAVYLYRRDVARLTAPSWPDALVVEDALANGSGICGAATLTALALYDAFDVKARKVEAWFRDPDDLFVGHVTTEVYYEGAWHWFDPTWGAFYRDGDDVLSVVEVARLSEDDQRDMLVANEATPRTQVFGGMEFVSYSPLMVVRDGQVVFSR